MFGHLGRPRRQRHAHQTAVYLLYYLADTTTITIVVRVVGTRRGGVIPGVGGRAGGSYSEQIAPLYTTIVLF